MNPFRVPNETTVLSVIHGGVHDILYGYGRHGAYVRVPDGKARVLFRHGGTEPQQSVS